MAINNATIGGNITRDMEVRTTNSGYAIGEFSVAVNERRKNQQGQYEDNPQFIDCKILGERAQKLSQYLTKGTKVTVSGKLQQDRWEDQQGNKRSKLYILVNDVEFMSRSDKPAQQPSAQQAVQQQWQGAQVSPYEGGGIPF